MYSCVDLLECFSLPKSDLKALDFTVTPFLTKLFRTSSMKVTAECQRHFGFSLRSELIQRKRNKFVHSYNNMSSFYNCRLVAVMI